MFEFNPKDFLSRINRVTFFEKNAAYNKTKIESVNQECFLCEHTKRFGIFLNDKSYLCEACFNRVCEIQYPETYQRLWENYLLEKKSIELAYEAFVEKYQHKPTEYNNPLWIIATCLLILFFIISYNGLIISSIILFIFALLIDNHNEKIELENKNEWEAVDQLWKDTHPLPYKPALRSFLDKDAYLTDYDKKIIKIFDHWPGYPPYWKRLRLIVLNRDNNRCQVSGCPSRVELHVHHIVPVSKGGAHKANNLVTLCKFHHALEPDKGHDRIMGHVKTDYFLIVQKHERSNRTSAGVHSVNAHLRRKELVKADELQLISDYYGLACPHCNSQSIEYRIDQTNDKVRFKCSGCEKEWQGPRKLTEETGAKLAEFLTVTRNKGVWRTRWNQLADSLDVSDTPTNTTINKNIVPNKKGIQGLVKEVECPQCGSPMRLIRPRPNINRVKSPFWGCTQYFITGCKGTREYTISEIMKENSHD